MSGTELAARMGVSEQTIADLERSEAHDTMRLETLRRAAKALDCDLVYFLVPRSSLEDQAVARDQADAQLDELTSWFVDRRGLWTEPDSSL